MKQNKNAATSGTSTFRLLSGSSSPHRRDEQGGSWRGPVSLACRCCSNGSGILVSSSFARGTVWFQRSARFSREQGSTYWVVPPRRSSLNAGALGAILLVHKMHKLGTISSDFLFWTCYVHNHRIRPLASQRGPFHPGNSLTRTHKYDYRPAVLCLARLMVSWQGGTTPNKVGFVYTCLYTCAFRCFIPADLHASCQSQHSCMLLVKLWLVAAGSICRCRTVALVGWQIWLHGRSQSHLAMYFTATDASRRGQPL